MTTLAGKLGTSGVADGQGAVARFNQPGAVAVDSAGNIYVADTGNHAVRKISPAGLVKTLAGVCGSACTANGTGRAARFRGVSGVTVDSAGTVYVTDNGNATIRKITSAGVVTTLAGTAAKTGNVDGVGDKARFMSPYGITVDKEKILYVADSWSGTIRKITSAGVVTTLAGKAGVQDYADGKGTAAQFSNVLGLAADSSGNLYATIPEPMSFAKSRPPGS